MITERASVRELELHEPVFLKLMSNLLELPSPRRGIGGWICRLLIIRENFCWRAVDAKNAFNMSPGEILNRVLLLVMICRTCVKQVPFSCASEPKHTQSNAERYLNATAMHCLVCFGDLQRERGCSWWKATRQPCDTEPRSRLPNAWRVGSGMLRRFLPITSDQF